MQVLEDVHRNYYAAFDKKSSDEKTSRRKMSRAHHLMDYDVRVSLYQCHALPSFGFSTRWLDVLLALLKKIIPGIRKHTLDGTHLLFSSVIPLDTRPESTEIWRTAEAFGAKCYTELGPRITHVVAAKVRSLLSDPHTYISNIPT